MAKGNKLQTDYINWLRTLRAIIKIKKPLKTAVFIVSRDDAAFGSEPYVT